jgi:prepilin-type N-terminal cleavage/methylation domain-containing protein
MHLKLKSRGDTIIEVMIVLAVLGLAISIAYATANRSLMDARQAQENGEATSLVQSQIEQLRGLASKYPSLDVFRTDVYFFCINENGTMNVTNFSPGTDFLDENIYPKGPANTPGECTFDERYNLSIHYEPPTASASPNASPDTFTVRAVWDDVSGQGQDTVTMAYKIHKP